MTSGKQLPSLVRTVSWALAWGLCGTLLLFAGWQHRRLQSMRQPVRQLQSRHAQQLEQIQAYADACDQLRQLATDLSRERAQVFSMLEYCRGRQDFVVSGGRHIVACRRFYDSQQREPTVFFYLPPGRHRLWWTSRATAQMNGMQQFMLDDALADATWESYELSGAEVYELRYFPIAVERPGSAGFELLGPDDDGDDRVLGRYELNFPAPVIGIGRGYGASDVFTLPQPYDDESPPLASGNGPIGRWTTLAQQEFRLAPGNPQQPDQDSPRGGVRIFVESMDSQVAVADVAIEQLIEHMRQPNLGAEEVMADLFGRADGWGKLLLTEELVHQ